MKKAISIILSALTALWLLAAPMAARAAAGVVSTAGGRLNVRASGSTGAAVVASLSDSSYVTLRQKSGAWWQVEYAKGQYGYCLSLIHI